LNAWEVPSLLPDESSETLCGDNARNTCSPSQRPWNADLNWLQMRFPCTVLGPRSDGLHKNAFHLSVRMDSSRSLGTADLDASFGHSELRHHWSVCPNNLCTVARRMKYRRSSRRSTTIIRRRIHQNFSSLNYTDILLRSLLGYIYI